MNYKYIIDGQERRITMEEMQKIMGFPDSFVFPVSKNQKMKQLGNSIIPDCVKMVATEVLKYLNKHDV